MPSISLITLNVERSKHLELVVPFLRRMSADIVCLQEVMEPDIPLIEEASGGVCVFAPMAFHEDNGQVALRGIAICSRLPVKNKEIVRYAGNPSSPVSFVDATTQSKHDTSSYILLVCDVEKEGKIFQVATTHFTWTPDGEADSYQRQDVQNMFTALEKLGELVLCGDFNAPRGKEIFSLLAERYRDNVPARYTTSIDGSLHRAGPIPYMVDGIFSTPGYTVSGVEMVSGVSDHCALVAIVSKD